MRRGAWHQIPCDIVGWFLRLLLDLLVLRWVSSNEYERFYWAVQLDRISSATKRSQLRDHGIQHFAWAVPSRDALDAVVNVAVPMAISNKQSECKLQLLDYGAGAGYWAFLLAHQLKDRCRVLACDPHPEWYKPPYRDATEWFPVSTCVESAFQTMSTLGHVDVLLLVWPPCSTLMAYDAALAFHGSVIVYVGEPMGGATASDEFFVHLRNAGWTPLLTVQLPNWQDRNDQLIIYSLPPRTQ